jgi:hypothetical protein
VFSLEGNTSLSLSLSPLPPLANLSPDLRGFCENLVRFRFPCPLPSYSIPSPPKTVFLVIDFSRQFHLMKNFYKEKERKGIKKNGGVDI